MKKKKVEIVKPTEPVELPPVYICPLTDFGFKRMFSDKELLLNFLNEALPDVSITEIKYQPTEVIGDIPDLRRAVFDLLCTTDKNENILVEMQVVRQYYFTDRALFYASHLIRQQAPKGPWDFNLKAVHVLAILDFELREGSEEIIERVALMNRRTLEVFSEKLSFTYIQLPHFTKTLEELENDFDRWLYLLRYIDKLTNKPPEVQGRIFERLFNMLQIKQLNEKEMEKYKSDYLNTTEGKSIVRYYTEYGKAHGMKLGEAHGMKLGEARGIKIGEMRGMKLGEARGMKIGEERGMQLGTRNTSLQIALDMAKEGEPIEKISKFTKVPVDELNEYFKREHK
jgi:predicted transposase/invertase (TIGR01784 family)